MSKLNTVIWKKWLYTKKYKLHTQSYIYTLNCCSVLLALYIAEQRLNSILFLKRFSSLQYLDIFTLLWGRAKNSLYCFCFCVFLLYTASQAPHDDKTLHTAQCISPHLSRNQEHGILNLYKDFRQCSCGDSRIYWSCSLSLGLFVFSVLGGGSTPVAALMMGRTSWFTKRRLWSPPPRGHYTQLACS